MAAAALLACLVLLSGQARAQFNCAEPACLDLTIVDGAGPITFAPVGSTIVVKPAYQFKAGTYTNVRVILDGSPYFIGSLAEVPDGWQRVCESLPVDPPSPPEQVWQARCTWTYLGDPADPGVLDVVTQSSGTIQTQFRSQLYETPANPGVWAEGQYTGVFGVRLEYTFGGADYSASVTASIDMRHELHVGHVPRPDHIGTSVRGVNGVYALGAPQNPRGRHFYQGFYVQNRQSLFGGAGSRYGTRTLTNTELEVELPAFVRYQGFSNGIELSNQANMRWSTGPNHTAVPGELGGVVHLRFDQPGSYPLGSSAKMTGWNSLQLNYNTAINTPTYLYLHYSVDCPPSTGNLIDLATTGSGTTPIVARATTTDLPTPLSVDAPYDLPKMTWLRAGSSDSSSAIGNGSCEARYTGSATNKTLPSNQQPGTRYPQTGDALYWNVRVTPPTTVTTLQQTTVIDKLPPYQHLLSGATNYVTRPAGWTSYVCRFDNSAGDLWQEVEVPVAATANYPQYGLDRYYRFDTNNLAIDPDVFDPDDIASVWWWDGTYGCHLATLACPHTNDNGVWTAPATCAGGLRANDVTHVVWTRDTWQDETQPGIADVTPFGANMYVVVGDLAGVPGGGRRVTVRNSMVIGGGQFANPDCAGQPLPDFAWLDRTCRDATTPATTIACPDICYATNAMPGDVRDHATRSAFAHMDAIIVPVATLRAAPSVVSRREDLTTPPIIGCGWSLRSTAARLPNPRFTITLPTAFEPVTSDYDVGTAYEATQWPISAGGPSVPELRYAKNAGGSPTIASLLAAGITLDVDKYQIDSDGDGTPDAWRYEIEFRPDAIEETFPLRTGNFLSGTSASPLYVRGYFQIAVRPSADYPYVGGQAYTTSCQITDANLPRDTAANTPGLAFNPVTSTGSMFVSMGAEIRMTAGPTCRPNSARPAYRVELTAGGVALDQAEGIFIVPLVTGFAFAGATLLPNAAITGSRVLEVTNTSNLDTTLSSNPDSVTWTALASFTDPLSTVTGVRLRFLPGGGNRLPAYGTVEFRVDLDRPGLTLADLGTQFTSLGWTRALGTTTIPYARSEPFEANTLGQCPIGVTVTKRFDDDANGAVDGTDTPLDDWTINLDVEVASSLGTAPLLNPDGTEAVDPHDDKTGVTGDTATGTVVFNVWPGQTYVVSETIPDPVTPYGPVWSFVAESPTPAGAWVASFDPADHAFANTCACGDDYSCGLADTCSAPGVCGFGQAGGGLGSAPPACEPFRFYALVEDGAGAFVGSVVCFLDETPVSGGPAIYCDADASGVLTVDNSRNACE